MRKRGIRRVVTDQERQTELGIHHLLARASSKLSLAACVLGLTLSTACWGERERDGTEPLPQSEVSAVQAEEIAALQALGYVEGDQPAPPTPGVTLHDRNRVSPGFNLYTSEHATRVFLLDMDGALLHMWELSLKGMLRRVKLFDNGEILALIEGKGLIRVDRENQVLWRFTEPAHHDFEVLEDGTIYVLTRETAMYPSYNDVNPIRNDFIVILNPDGSRRKKISVLKALQTSTCCKHFLKEGMDGDVFHANTLEVLDGRLEHKHPAFRRGNLLTSWLTLNTIGIIDVDSEEVIWHMEGVFHKQHQPTVLENENLLVFDNIDYRRGENVSRVVEIDPITKKIHWEFRSSKAFHFFSRSGGSSAQLANGNFLISETRKGRVFEVSSEGDVVWTYLNPARVRNRTGTIARIFEMQRLSPDTPMDWLPRRTFPGDALTRHSALSP